jgi:hypothetical protein
MEELKREITQTPRRAQTNLPAEGTARSLSGVAGPVDVIRIRHQRQDAALA